MLVYLTYRKVIKRLTSLPFRIFVTTFSYFGNSDANSPEDDDDDTETDAGTEAGTEDNSIVRNYFDTTGEQNFEKDEENEKNLLRRMLEDEEDSTDSGTIIASKRILTSIKVTYFTFYVILILLLSYLFLI